VLDAFDYSGNFIERKAAFYDRGGTAGGAGIDIYWNNIGYSYNLYLSGSSSQFTGFSGITTTSNSYDYTTSNQYNFTLNGLPNYTGLTITSANHVIHFNRQWNPAIEKQATARSYRRGQDKPVFVYKMFYLGTVEEVIHERLQSKEFLATTSLTDAVAEGDNKEIQKALSMSPIFKK
jgi:hypothetical protein